MGLVLRYQWESYMDCSSTAGITDFQLIGNGFTTFPESKKPTKYVRKYYGDKTEQTDVVRYSPSMKYSCDVITDDPVIAKIVSITDKEQVGENTKVDIVSVNLWEETSTKGVYVAYKRTFTIVPDGKGDGTGSMSYTGTMEASGDNVSGTFNRSTKTFTPDKNEEDDDDETEITLDSRTVRPTEKEQVISPSVGYDGLAYVTVKPIATEEKTVTVTEGGEIAITPSEGAYLKKVTVVVPEVSTYLLIDGDGTEVPATAVSNEMIFDATENDIRKGTTAATDAGITRGQKVIPSYFTISGYRLIQAGKEFATPELSELDQYDFTRFQAIICPFDRAVTESVAAEKVAIEESVYEVKSSIPIATVQRDSKNKTINLGITNTSEKMYLMRYFTYKEIE